MTWRVRVRLRVFHRGQDQPVPLKGDDPLATVKVTDKGVITLPKAVRDRLGVTAGRCIALIEIEEGFLVRAARRDVSVLKDVLARPAGCVSVAVMSRAVARMGRISARCELSPLRVSGRRTEGLS